MVTPPPPRDLHQPKKPDAYRVKKGRKSNFAFLIKKKNAKYALFQRASYSVFQLAQPSIGKPVSQQTLERNSEQPNSVLFVSHGRTFHINI